LSNHLPRLIFLVKIILMSKKHSSLIGAATGWGAQKRTTEHGPDAMKHFGLAEKLQQENISVSWQEIVYPYLRFANDNDIAPGHCIPYVTDMCQNVFNAVSKSLQQGNFPCVIGGDHSIAVGTWSAMATSMAASEQFGLIWFDAHMDAHTPKTSPSLAYHGMPVASLLGYGAPELTELGGKGAKLKPEHVVLIGARSFEAGEQNLLTELGVRIYYMDEIRARGFEDVLKEAIAIVSKGTSGFGLSLDLDGFDPSDTPGVGSPATGGLTQAEVLPTLHMLRDHPKFQALEITEFNPHLDQQMKTAHLIHKILRELLERDC
jgi:arginase